MSQKILLLFDLSETPKSQDFSEDLASGDDHWKSEADVLNALRALGHVVTPFGLHDDLQSLIQAVKDVQPDLVFNLSEAFAGNRDFEQHLPALLELLKTRFTGARPAVLQLCKDKGLTKKILAYHGIRVPHFAVLRKGQAIYSSDLKSLIYPALVKPLNLESSVGISRDSFVEDQASCLERVRYLHERLGCDVIVEEFIEGRELYVGVLGNEKLEAFKPRELFFKQVPKDKPTFATYHAKWDDAYRARWGIQNGKADSLGAALEEKLLVTCKRIYSLLQMNGYGRIDLRLTPTGEIVFLEANPNPSIASEDDFAQAALDSGVSYQKLIAKILKLAQ